MVSKTVAAVLKIVVKHKPGGVDHPQGRHAGARGQAGGTVNFTPQPYTNQQEINASLKRVGMTSEDLQNTLKLGDDVVVDARIGAGPKSGTTVIATISDKGGERFVGRIWRSYETTPAGVKRAVNDDISLTTALSKRERQDYKALLDSTHTAALKNTGIQETYSSPEWSGVGQKRPGLKKPSLKGPGIKSP